MFAIVEIHRVYVTKIGEKDALAADISIKHPDNPKGEQTITWTEFDTLSIQSQDKTKRITLGKPIISISSQPLPDI